MQIDSSSSSSAGSADDIIIGDDEYESLSERGEKDKDLIYSDGESSSFSLCDYDTGCGAELTGGTVIDEATEEEYLPLIPTDTLPLELFR